MRDELHLAARGLGALAIAAVVLAVVAGASVGVAGVASVLLGGGIVASNHLLAAISTGWARTLGPGVLAVGYAFFVVRMFAVLGTLAAATTLPWVHRGFVAVAFCVALVVSLGAECWSYVRTSYVPSWRVIAR
jgi:hypothetical protein